jgi:hypothetical protein
MKIKYLSLLLLLLPTLSFSEPIAVVSHAKFTSYPDIGTTNEVSVGEQMLAQGISAQVKGVKFPLPFRVATINYAAGFYPESNEDDKYIYLFANGGEKREGYGYALPKKVFGIDVTASGMKFKVLKNEQRVCMGGNCANAQFSTSEMTQTSDSDFQQTLLYNGANGNKIRLGYREFKSDMARAAYSNDIEYDLTSSKIVAYKHAKIEVIQADNTSVKYKVISNF